MHTRHLSPGSIRGHGMHYPEYQNYNHGPGHGGPPPKMFQPPPPLSLPHPDIFMEAGQLATEYLISKGLLPPHVLSGKWQNGSLKNHGGYFPGYRHHEGGNSFPPEGRTSALSRLGDAQSSMSRNFIRGRRRMGWSKSYGPDRGRDVGSDSGFGYQEEREVGNHYSRGVPRSHSYEMLAKRDNSKNAESSLDKSQFPEGGMSRKASSSSSGKDLPIEDGAKLTDDPISNDEMERKMAVDDDSVQHCAVEVDPISKNDKDFAEVMTKTCSLSTIEGPKVVLAPITDEQNHSEEHVKSAENDGELVSDYAIEQGKCSRSRSFSVGSFSNEQKSRESQPELRISSSMVIERGEKRALPFADNRDGAKRSKEWFHSMSNLGENQLISQEGKSSSVEEVILGANQETPIESGMNYAEEKQISSGSFKIFDLNLMEAPDEYENHDTEQLIFPYASESKRVDTGSSMSNNWNISDKFGKCGADGKEVEVIDLENDSIQDEKAFDHSVRKAEENELTGLESFPNHVENNNDIPDAQNGYGLLMSEFIGSDFSNCPVSPDVNSLHNVGGLHTGEEILGDDESIYMSLGDIPINFLRGWEQPTRENDKFL